MFTTYFAQLCNFIFRLKRLLLCYLPIFLFFNLYFIINGKLWDILHEDVYIVIHYVAALYSQLYRDSTTVTRIM